MTQTSTLLTERHKRRLTAKKRLDRRYNIVFFAFLGIAIFIVGGVVKGVINSNYQTQLLKKIILDLKEIRDTQTGTDDDLPEYNDGSGIDT